MRGQFRAQVQGQMVAQAESAYVANLVEAADVKPDTASFESVRQLAADPYLDLPPRALNRKLVEYEGGNLTLGEYREWLLTSPPNVAPQIEAANNDQLSNLLQGLTRSELLVNDAVARGIEIPESRGDSVAAEILGAVKEISQELGFFGITPEEGESEEAAADRVVREILEEIVQRDRQAIQLQTIAFLLREQFGAKIHQPGINKAVQRINELRTQLPGAAVPGPSPDSADTIMTDTMATDSAGG